jgi:hypothetical protein
MRPATPRWSPDGSRIVFVGQTAGHHWKLYLVPRDGGIVQPLLPGDNVEGDPTWAPNGGSLAFAMNDAIHVVALESQQVSKVSGSDGLFSPRWSPDGRHLSAMPLDGGKQVLFDFNTGHWIDLAEIPGGYLHWSHDGRYLYFLRNGETPLLPGSVCRIGVSDKKLEQVVDLKGLRLGFGVFGTWAGLAPDDSPILMLDQSRHEIYALDWEAP